MITAPRRPSRPAAAPTGGELAGRGPGRPEGWNSIYFWPIYTGQTIPMDSWQNRMWLDTWV